MEKISANEFVKIGKEKPLRVIDVRTADEYARRHIPGSLLIPVDEIESRLPDISRDEKVYVICERGNRSQRACERLGDLGIGNTVTIEGGITAVAKAGGNLSITKRGLPIMRQVQLIAGSLVVLGVLLSLFVHPAFVYLSLAVGAGLAFAGASGHCMLATALASLPFNRNAPLMADKKASCCE